MYDDTAEFWCDVMLVEGEEPLITYRTGMVVYEESLTKGRFVSRGWNGAVFVNFYDGRIDPLAIPLPQAFRLEIDGQFLGGEWQWVCFERRDNDQPIPAMPRPYQIHTIVTLQHAVRPITVQVHTGLDGSAVLTRWLEVTNTGAQPAALASAASMSPAATASPSTTPDVPARWTA